MADQLTEAITGIIEAMIHRGVVVTPVESGWLVRLADESESTLDSATISRSW
jgi:hypothetical protein